MKKRNISKHSILLTAALLLFATGLLSQQTSRPGISEEEVRVPGVEFINRDYRRADRTVIENNLRTGRQAAEQVIKDNHGESDAYKVVRVFNPDTERFGADIVTIDARANIGHINMVKRFLIGYLSTAYEYSAQDAEVLSQFILYYNARNRGNIDALKAKYSDEVISNLNQATLGIDRSYRNWAGKTQLVIPLKKNVVRPGRTDIDNKEIQDNKANPDEQKKIEEVQQRRNEEDTNRLIQKEQELQKKQEEINTQQQKVQETQQQIQKQQENTNQKIQELNRDPVRNAEQIKQEQTKAQELQKQQEQVTQQQQEIQKQQEQVKQQQQEVQQQQKEIAQQQQPQQEPAKQDVATNTTQTTEQKPAEQQQPATNTQAEQKKEEQPSQNVVGEKILFLRILRYLQGGHYNNELWTIDTANNDKLIRGPYTSICGKDFLVIPEQGVLVIGYNGASHEDSGHHFVLLDTDTLVVKRESKEEIFWRTPLNSPAVYRDGKIYAFEIFNGQHYLSRFNIDLTLDARSSDPISTNSDITFYRDKIYLTGKSQNGDVTTIAVFNKADLKLIKTLNPDQP